MAEGAIGLGVGVAGLAGLFNSAVDTYGLVRLGKTYARDFETSQTKLDVSRLRLSRWGTALELEENSTRLPFGTAKEVAKAELMLQNNVDLLEDASAQSVRYASRRDPETTEMLDPNMSRIHRSWRQLLERRQRDTRLRDKAHWALYGKRDLDGLVDDIRELTTDPNDLFPATKSRQQELSAREISGMDSESLAFVEEFAQDQDAILTEAVQKAIQGLGHTYNKAHARDGAAEHNGDIVAHGYRGPIGNLCHTYQEPLAEGRGTRQHNGNLYGGERL